MSGKKKYMTNVAEQNFHMQIKWARIQELPEVKKLNEEIKSLENKYSKEQDRIFDYLANVRKKFQSNSITPKEIEQEFEKLTQEEKKNKEKLNVIEQEIKEKKIKLKDFIISLGEDYSMSKLKEFFPNYYKTFEKDFNTLFNKWIANTQNREKVKSLRSEIWEIIESQVLNNLNSNPQLVNSAENTSKNVLGKLSIDIINKPLLLLNILLASMIDDKEEFTKTTNHFKKKLDKTEKENKEIRQKSNEMRNYAFREIIDVYQKRNFGVFDSKVSSSNHNVSNQTEEGKAGRQGKYTSEQNLVNAIKSIPNFLNLSRAQIGRQLNFNGKTPGSSLNNALDKFGLPRDLSKL